ncbi:Transcriptional regulator, LuxR family [Candidatus Desulfarcum epimagneticum]|uniref:Transcriptional regulator, LuxR family n=1 Tax=uncultured Desulfobacteraceae bacterium TaxID=218296 RepID=A0A484HL20_9BACT|nr:Transcriptional regulator, LuxR family [uncultured Desulfobacteraceae bacterium]
MFIQGYSEVSVKRAGVRSDVVCDLKWGAHFKFNRDIRELFPYINGAVPDARYQVRPPHTRFVHENVQCSLYPKEAMVAPFRGQRQCFLFIENLIRFLNDLYDRRKSLSPSHKVYREPVSVMDILKALPRNNCRECGRKTCMAFAVALREGEASPAQCPGLAKPITTYTVFPVLGEDGTVKSTFAIESEAGEPRADETRAPSADGKSDKTRRDRFGIRIQYDLTPREIEVLRCVAEGATNPEISERLNISPHTVKSHVIHIFNKINVNHRAQAAVWAAKNQVV